MHVGQFILLKKSFVELLISQLNNVVYCDSFSLYPGSVYKMLWSVSYPAKSSNSMCTFKQTGKLDLHGLNLN